MKNTRAKLDAIEAYRDRTYKRYKFFLLNERDANILTAMEEAKEHGYTYRQWIRDLFDNAK